MSASCSDRSPRTSAKANAQVSIGALITLTHMPRRSCPSTRPCSSPLYPHLPRAPWREDCSKSHTIWSRRCPKPSLLVRPAPQANQCTGRCQGADVDRYSRRTLDGGPARAPRCVRVPALAPLTRPRSAERRDVAGFSNSRLPSRPIPTPTRSTSESARTAMTTASRGFCRS